ncbi:MAG TPA: hypothetical protein DDW52_26030 [Planctomycetaceae bacterium]|nr:hypothetical protein [Planctomycetaceae bacterium]
MQLFDFTHFRALRSACKNESPRWCLIVVCLTATLVTANALAFVLLTNSDTNVGYAVVSKKWALASSDKTQSDVLIVGDSSGDQGIDPEAFESLSGLTALNLCTFGDLLTVDDLWLLERRILEGAAPKHVIMIHVYDMWHRVDPNLAALRQAPLSWSQWDQHTEIIPLGTAWKLRVLLDRYVPLLSRRDSLRQILLRGGLMQPETTFTPRGFRPVSKVNQERTRKDRTQHLAFLGANTFHPSAVNEAALERVLSLCEEHSIQFWLFNSPVEAELARSPLFRDYHREVIDWLEEQVRDFPNATVNRELYTVSIEHCERVDHIDTTAASEYTAFVSERVFSQSPTDRLPAK